MKRSDDRILTTHVGSLVRPPELIELVRARGRGEPGNDAAMSALVANATADVVRQQADAGVDVVSDGEYGKPNFAGYVSDRLSGFEAREPKPGESAIGNWGRDRLAFREFYEQDASAQAGSPGVQMVCTGPIAYVGQERVQADIANFKAA
jgi:5-methyltetrahydropteroyltriglutamate--homocysteine methyltransferase